ncbi:hypothetical protein [Streptomyces sp. NPDC055287]
MDDFPESSEVNDQAATGPDETPRRGSAAKRRVAGVVRAGKTLLKNEALVSAVFVGTLALLEILADGRGDDEGIELPPVAVAEDADTAPALTAEGSKRKGPEPHQVKGALVDLGDRQASTTAQENYRRAGGGDLPPGKTYRKPHSRGGPEPEDFGLSV